VVPQELFKDKIVLITGGTGSFGRTFARRLLAEDLCRKVIIFSRDELKQWEIQQSDPLFRHPKVRYFLGDVRDVDRLKRAFREVNYVIHAAALKQVPAAEYNPTEFIKTNVIGAMNVIDAAISCKVDKVVALSTDKAVNPINLYGATKLCSDKLFCAGESYVGDQGKPSFAVVRYGNVLGSRGSIIPLWQKLIADGAPALPITDLRMTRFWITLDQAVDFVVRSLADMHGGEIFVPKIPSMKITDLALALAPTLPHTITGIRPGEKLHELMIGSDDSRHTVEFESYYIIMPEHYAVDPHLRSEFLHGRIGSALPELFAYTSDSNCCWLSPEALREQLHLKIEPSEQ
jgi:UDP-N-acetylglucosamine 4,6-dehydratase